MAKVFISYAHASVEHRAAVRDLWVLLRNSGIDVVVDWWGPENVRRDWSSWATKQITDADFVLVVASPEYRRLATQSGKSGVRAEAQIIRAGLVASGGSSPGLAAVVLPGHSASEVPDFLTASGTPVQVLEGLTVRGVRRLVHSILARSPETGGETESGTIAEPDPEPTEVQRRPAVLVLATEWSSARGGLSTLNRQLCCALAAREAEVVCLVLAADDEDRRQAAANGVVLRVAVRPPGGSDDTALSNPADLPTGFRPDYIIGHSRVTGPAASHIATRFPGAKRLHFIHMAPDEIEWYKPGRKDDAGQRSEERQQIELNLARTAHATITIGLLLYNRYLRDLSPDKDVLVHNLVPGFDVAGYTCSAPPPGAPWKILIAGRLEDTEVKGLDIAARAVGRFARNRPATAPRVELVVRGAPPGEAEQLRKQILEWADLPSLKVVVRPYAADQDTMIADLKTSTLVLMPSRGEGFGLIGLEAAAAGVPVLISESSGLGEQLLAALAPADYDRVVIRMTDDEEADADEWHRHIHATLYDRDAAFARAARVREQLIASYTWAKAISGLFAAI
ncbi:glycosyltransferase [Amycolatopsis sp.]|uniref:glycosyltransferase n=1 Tax=Amycolatopsis sp. TaxID=37632 RepID=UPI002D8110BC|nr:glycosyltransferase [Amycolatopsis sp.]HET6708180.1 glycosyltransferase [Amycolatopsis sp.]